MKEILVIVIALLLGSGVGAAYHYSQFSGEDTRFEVSKTIGSLDVTDRDPSEGRPKVRVENGAVHDFGTMGKNETRKHTFQIRNVGDFPLQIKLLETSCKCTLAELEDAEIAPGDTQPLTLEWTPEDYSDSFAQNARIQTNDPELRILELRVVGKVSVPVRPIPAELVVPTIPVAEGFAKSIDILAYEADDLKVTDWSWSDPAVAEQFEVTIETIGVDGEAFQDDSVTSGVRINVIAKPGLPLGPLEQMLIIATNQPDEPPFEIPVLGRVQGNYEFSTGRDVPFNADRNVIDLGRLNSASERTVMINLFVRGDAADSVEISIAEGDVTPSSVLTAVVLDKKNVGPLTSFPIELSLKGAGQSISRLGPQPQDLGVVVLKTTDPSTPEIRLYVKFALTE